MFELLNFGERRLTVPARAHGVQLRCERLEERVVPGGGALDQSFGQGGIVSTQVGGTPLGTAQQADGKLVVVLQGGVNQDGFVLTRYNTDGTVDTSFGTNGLVDLQFAHNATSCSLLIQPDGKIVVGGSAGDEQTLFWFHVTDFALARFNADGSPDTTFGSGGMVSTLFTTTTNDHTYWDMSRIEKIALQADGRIVVVGEVDLIATAARYNADGSLDSTFGTNGIVKLTVPWIQSAVNDLAVQPDGKILVLGTSYGDSEGWLLRLNADGSADPSFSPINPVGVKSTPAAFALQPDGKILVTMKEWTVFNGVTGDLLAVGGFALARFNSDGTPDSEFGQAGQVSIPWTTNAEAVMGVMLDRQGRIIVTGWAGTTDDSLQMDSHFTLRRFDAEGALDNTFGDGGMVVTEAAVTASSLIQADGKIVVAGNNWLNTPETLVLARYSDDDGGPPPLAAQSGGGPRSFAATGNGGKPIEFSPGFFFVDVGSGSTNHSTNRPADEVPAAPSLGRSRGPTAVPTDPAFLGGVFVG
jgi:uncharacterized delta-60 repeat protein